MDKVISDIAQINQVSRKSMFEEPIEEQISKIWINNFDF